jgi:hypothetical protein
MDDAKGKAMVYIRVCEVSHISFSIARMLNFG